MAARANSLETPTDSVKRNHIIEVIKLTAGRDAGPKAVAARLGIKRVTLISRMKKIGTDPRRLFYRSGARPTPAIPLITT
jgi:transcriptional regulator with GAF, ATPase, and Fis domain